MADNARKRLAGSLRSMPIFNGEAPWNVHKLCFENWAHFGGLYDPNITVDERKSILIQSISQNMCLRVMSMLRTSPTWNAAATFEAYMTAIGAVFQPEAESQLARTEFRACKQGRNEDMQTFMSRKIQLWMQAFPVGERNFSTLMDDCCDSICNPVVRRRLKHSDVTTKEEMVETVLSIVAKERQCVMGGYGESSNLEGLALSTVVFKATTNQYDEYGDERMDISAIKDKKCYRCDRLGHLKKDCRVKEENLPFRNRGKGGKGKAGGGWKQKANFAPDNKKKDRNCFNCGGKGHYQKECKKPKKAVKQVTDGGSASGHGDGEHQDLFAGEESD